MEPKWNGSFFLRRCPECGTYYLHKTVYEYLTTGSEDEDFLDRITDEEASQYFDQPDFK